MTSPPTLAFPFQGRPSARNGAGAACSACWSACWCSAACWPPTCRRSGHRDRWVHHYQITQKAYEQKYGLWTKLNIPVKFRVTASTRPAVQRDVLIMAGRVTTRRTSTPGRSRPCCSTRSPCRRS